MNRAAFAVVCALAVACNKQETPPAAEQPHAPVANPPAAARTASDSAPLTNSAAAVAPASENRPAGEPSAAASQVSETSFELKIAEAGPVAVGKPAQAHIVLEAKPPFHVNDKYPYKFKLKDSAGLTFPSQVVGKDSVSLEKTRAQMTVPFTASEPGKHMLAGQFAFSICTDDKCLIEKRDLALAVEAK